MKAKHPGVPHDVLVALRLACRDLPEANEETAWVGVRWRVRGKDIRARADAGLSMVGVNGRLRRKRKREATQRNAGT